MTTAISVQGLHKQFGKKEVLHNINLEVEEGQIYGLIGPSGSGKTTLIKAIIGMDSPTKGKVTVLSFPIPNINVLPQIGYMAQSDALYPELTAKENLDFFASLFLMKKKEKEKRIAYVASLVALTPFLYKRVNTFSGGMKRRLSLAIALIHNPQILILDEPTVGIDPVLRVSIWNELLQLKESGKTIIVTTHVMDELEKCDALALVRDGEILTSGTPKQLRAKYNIDKLEEIFLLKSEVQE